MLSGKQKEDEQIMQLKFITLEELLERDWPKDKKWDGKEKMQCRYCRNQVKYSVQDLNEPSMIRHVCEVCVRQFKDNKTQKIL